MKRKVLILFFNNPEKRNIFFDNMNLKNDVQAACVLKNVSAPFRILRRIHFISGFPGIQIWFTHWHKKIFDYSLIICIATKYSHRTLKWIAKRTQSRQIHYFWDEIHISRYPVKKENAYENWSFCYNNSLEYKMKYNPQFWISTINLKSDRTEYDVSYVGGDRNGKYKERTKMVNQIFLKLAKENIKCFFWYISDSDKVDSRIKKDRELQQKDFLEIIKKSKVIIELVENDIQWITQRTLYALSNEKKLITNNLDILHEPLYCKENIFILGYDKMTNLVDFIKSPYVKMDNNILQYYEMDQWMERFLDG